MLMWQLMLYRRTRKSKYHCVVSALVESTADSLRTVDSAMILIRTSCLTIATNVICWTGRRQIDDHDDDDDDVNDCCVVHVMQRCEKYLRRCFLNWRSNVTTRTDYWGNVLFITVNYVIFISVVEVWLPVRWPSVHSNELQPSALDVVLGHGRPPQTIVCSVHSDPVTHLHMTAHGSEPGVTNTIIVRIYTILPCRS